MATADDQILVLHMDDGKDWAKFLSSRLADPRYGITSVLRHLAPKADQATPPPPPPRKFASLKSASEKDSSLSKDEKSVEEEEIYINNPCDDNNNPNRQSSVRDSCVKGTGHDNLEQHVRQSKATVVFLSPDIVQGETQFPVDVTVFTPKTTVFLLLGVEVEEARSFFGAKSDVAFKCRISVVDGSESTIRDALTQIIEAYECCVGEEEEVGEDIYQHPPSPVQANKMEKVFPKNLTPEDRAVYILLARQAEDNALVVLEENMSMEIPLTQVCDRLYSFTIPKTLHGKISFHVECHGHTVGEASVTVVTPLDQIREILAKEVTPLAVLATALGLQPEDVGGVDTALAFKLQELASTITFSRMFPCEESLGHSNSDEHSNLMWPSLLHFAADLNLRTLCSELLRYPGMLAAALTENRDGLYPCQMAAKRGFTQMEHDLLKFVDSHKTECYDSDSSDYMVPSASLMIPQGPSPPAQGPPRRPGHKSQAQDPQDDGQVYVQMAGGTATRQPALGLQQQHSVQSGDSVFGSTGSQEDELYINLEETKSCILTGATSRDSTLTRHHSDLSSPGLSPSASGTQSPTSTKALKMLGVKEDDIVRSRASTITGSSAASSDFDPPSWLPYLAATPPGGHLPGLAVTPPNSGSRNSVSSNCEDPHLYIGPTEHKPTVMRDKLKSFLFKIRGGNKRNNSEGDIATLSAMKKNSNSRTSVSSNKSDNKLSSSKKSKSFSQEDSQERDSGSYSDEEKSKTSPILKRNKQRVFKESDRPMNRRISRRAQIAKKEKISDAPSLPSQEKRGTFKSFIAKDSSVERL